MKTILVAGNECQASHIHEISRLLDLLRAAGMRLKVQEPFAFYLRNHGLNISEGEITAVPVPEAYAAVSVGGDGTLLRAARWIGLEQTPIIGFNTGHLGFLASYTPDETEEIVALLRDGTGVVEKRFALRVSVDGEPVTPMPFALNEVAFLKDDTASMISLHVEIDGAFLADYMADGLLVSTPTGSTGYNLSAGGPILQPTMRCMAVTPIAAHSLTLRPLVVEGNSRFTVRASSRAKHFRLSLDGVSQTLGCNSVVQIEAADFSPRLMRAPGATFAETLRRKLLWGTYSN